MSARQVPVYLVQLGHRCLPLSLGMIEAFARRWGAGDLLRRLQFHRLISPDPDRLSGAPPGIWLFSNYLWSAEFNAEVSRAVRRDDPRHVTVHGGPNVPKYEAACETFLAQRPDVDIAVRGEGELTAAELLDALARAFEAGSDWRAEAKTVAGLSFLDAPGGAVVRTSERPRLTNLDALPSPYLDGTLESWLRPRAGMATLETNRGCPYACTFCDWGSATQQKIHVFGLDRVLAEIEWIAAHEIPVLFIADANFGVLERDLEIAAHVARMRRRYGHPKEVMVSYAKNGNERIAELVRVMVAGGVVTSGVVSIQTADPGTLRAVRRTNIRTRNYEKLVGIFRREGLPVSADLMVGLPGATLDSYRRDLQWCLDEDLIARSFPTFLLPNSPMAEPGYVAEHGLQARNGVVCATAQASEADLAEVYDLSQMYDIGEKSSLLRYVLRHLQWRHGLPASQVLLSLSRAVRQRPEAFPAYLTGLDRSACLNGVLADPASFYDAVWDHVQHAFGIALGSDEDRAVWRLNAAVVPRRGERYPLYVESPWDVLSYFASCVSPAAGEARRLALVDPPQRFEISDPEGYATADPGRLAINVNSGFRVFELDWPAKQRGAVAAMYGDAAHSWRSMNLPAASEAGTRADAADRRAS